MTRLLVISSEKDVAAEAELVNALFEAGMQLFHLRKPNWSVEQQQDFLSQLQPEFLNRVSVHQHYQTIDTFNLAYCHVKENNRKGFLKTRSAKYSTSFHNYNDLQFESHFWDYCFLSPVFDSISKDNYKSAFAENFAIEEDLYQRVFALGGVNKNNLAKVFEKGFYGAAVLGALWSNPQKAIDNFKQLDVLCQQRVHTF